MRDAAERLIAMAERIRKNDMDEFCGCIVVLPPTPQNGDGGDPIEILLIDPRKDPRNFWATAKAEVELGEYHWKERADQAQRGFR